MTQFSVQLSTQDFRRELDAFMRLLPKDVIVPAVKKIAFDVLADIVRGVTVDSPTRVDTGRYRAGYRLALIDGAVSGAGALPSSSKSKTGDGEMVYSGTGLAFEAEIINHVDYALLVEDGTAKMRPGNHVKRALAAAKLNIVALTQQMRKAIAAGFGGP
jgi:hypothetical protein